MLLSFLAFNWSVRKSGDRIYVGKHHREGSKLSGGTQLAFSEQNEAAKTEGLQKGLVEVH